MAYTRDGAGTFWIKNNVDQVVETIKETAENEDEETFGSYNIGSFQTGEIYIDTFRGKNTLNITGIIEDVYTSIQIPLIPDKELIKITEKLVDIVDLKPKESGLFLTPDNFEEVRRKTADGQGRINLGSERAGKDVRVVVMDSKSKEK